MCYRRLTNNVVLVVFHAIDMLPKLLIVPVICRKSVLSGVPARR